MSFNDEITDKMPPALRDKLYWAGAYSDEDTGDQTYCNAAWEDDVTDFECAAADVVFDHHYPDMARINHTGHCPEEIWNVPNWMDGASKIAPGSGQAIPSWLDESSYYADLRKDITG